MDGWINYLIATDIAPRNMNLVQNYLCKENRFRVRIFGLHLAIGQLYNLNNTVQTPLIGYPV